MISEFAKEKVFWTRKMNLKLVKFIESRQNIWNPKHPKYTSVEFRDQTYADFASKYGNEFSGQAVKDRWTNIRSTFANYLRKMKASRDKGDGEEYKVRWHLWDACHFLRKVNRAVKAETCVEDEKKDEKSFMIDEQDWNSEEEYPNLRDDETNGSSYSCNNIAENLVSAFKGIQNDAFGIDNTYHGQVGKAVTKKLSQMNSYNAAKASHKIIEILLLYDVNNPMNPNNSKD